MDKDIILTNGEVLNIKVNFYSLYLIKKEKLDRKLNRINRSRERYKELKKTKPNEFKSKMERLEDEEFDLASNLIYIIFRSNGKMITFEEALMLCPADPDDIVKLVNQFSDKIQNLKKKEAMKM